MLKTNCIILLLFIRSIPKRFENVLSDHRKVLNSSILQHIGCIWLFISREPELNGSIQFVLNKTYSKSMKLQTVHCGQGTVPVSCICLLTHDVVCLQVLCGQSRAVLSRAAGRRALASLRAGTSRTFSAASSDEPYIAVSHTDSGESHRKGRQCRFQ